MRDRGPRSSATLSERVFEVYWPQTSPFVARDRTKVLAQNTKGQAEILQLIMRFRERHAPDPSAPLSQARVHAKERFERLVREVEWKLVEMPLPRLQTVGTSDDPFLYRIGWTREVKRAEFVSPSFDKRIRFIERSGDYLVQLAGLLRPLVQRQWARMVSRLNEDVMLSSTLGWESRPDQTLAVARSIYLRLSEGAKLWDRGKEFAALNQEAVRAALGAAAP